MDKNLIGILLDDQYQIDTLIGVGGMANVYKATDVRSGRTVAVKMLKEECMANEELVRRFKNESKAISILNHPNIVKVWDVSTYEGRPYIVMEYIDGITLKEYLNQRGGPLTWKEVVHFISKVLSALEHAHSKGIVHRDVKPQNIMLLADGNIKMMDFGIARFSRSQSHTISDKAIGSVHYISPEQAKGDLTGATADIYSVGIMMYEMLSGRLPFLSDSAVSIAIMQISDQAVPLNKVAPGVPLGLQQITERAMAKRPEDRYPTARAMLDDLDAFKRNTNIQFAPVQPVSPNTEENGGEKQKQSRSLNDQGARRQSASAPKPKEVPVNAVTMAGIQTKKLVNEMATRMKQNNTGRKKRKDFLPVFAGMTLAFAVAAFVLCFCIFATSTNPLFSMREDMILGDFVGLTAAEVQTVEGYDKLNIVYEEVYNSNHEAGVIYMQSPRAGRTVKEGQTVTLTVSLGTQWVEVPNLLNWDSSDAQDLLKENNLAVRINYQMNDSVATGTVFQTEPAAGTTVEANTVVTLYVAQAQVDLEREVPSVEGLELTEAKSLISAAGLVPVIEEVPSTDPKDTVVSQSIAGGSKVKILTRITLQVSTGVVEVPVGADRVNLNDGGITFHRGDEPVVCQVCGQQIWEEWGDTFRCRNCGSAIVW